MAIESSKKKKVTAKVEGVAVPLKWNIPENIITRFASNIVIQRLEDVFKISFFEINPDIKTGIEKKVPDEVQANCVASIIVTADKFSVFVDLLQRQLVMNQKRKANPVLPIVSSEH